MNWQLGNRRQLLKVSNSTGLEIARWRNGRRKDSVIAYKMVSEKLWVQFPLLLRKKHKMEFPCLELGGFYKS